MGGTETIDTSLFTAFFFGTRLSQKIKSFMETTMCYQRSLGTSGKLVLNNCTSEVPLSSDRTASSLTHARYSRRSRATNYLDSQTPSYVVSPSYATCAFSLVPPDIKEYMPL